MAWSSAYPRRSGVFTIEILERPQSLKGQLREGLETIKEKIGRPRISLGMVSHVQLSHWNCCTNACMNM